MIDHERVIAAESERFVAALGRAGGAAAVPTAPAWTADDLLWHLTEVQWFWAAIVAGRLADPAGAEAAVPARPDDREALIALARAGASALVEALAGAADDEPVWTWSDDRTVGLVRRRQLHEAVIHRVDAELTAGSVVTPIDPEAVIHRVDAELTAGSVVTPIDPEVAVDGVDEVFDVFVSGLPAWMTFAPDGTHVAVEVDGGRRWSYAFGRAVGTPPDSGTTLDLPALDAAGAGARPDATIRGRAADVLLWLWGRGPLAPLTVTGDATVAARLRTLIAEATEQ